MCNPHHVYPRRVEPSVLVFSLSLYRQKKVTEMYSLYLSLYLFVHNKNQGNTQIGCRCYERLNLKILTHNFYGLKGEYRNRGVGVKEIQR